MHRCNGGKPKLKFFKTVVRVQRAFLLRTELSVLFFDMAEKHPIREQGALSADRVSAAERGMTQAPLHHH